MNKLILTTLIGIAMGTASAQAIVYYANTDLTTAPAGTTFTAVGGDLGTKSQAGFTILGVTGGASGNEIDIGESLTISFETAQIFSSLTLGLLFDGPEYLDYNEIAAVDVNGGISVYNLTANGTTSASWTGSGSVAALGSAVDGGWGGWEISNPFGNTSITSLKLYPLSSLPAPDGTEPTRTNESDFGLHAFSTTAVPDDGITLILLGLGLSGLAVGRRFLKA